MGPLTLSPILFLAWAATAELPGSVVHVIPHSHVDPGWLRTFDEYYPTVRSILKAVAVELLAGPNRTFLWEGTAFLSRWLDEHENKDLDGGGHGFTGGHKAAKAKATLIDKLSLPRPPWRPHEAHTVRRRLQEACADRVSHKALLGPGSCHHPCPGFLRSPDPRDHGAMLKEDKRASAAANAGVDASFTCPSWGGLVRYLVGSGQLEIGGGGWVSHDEALSSPRGSLDQLTLGRRRLLALGLQSPLLGGGRDGGVSWQVDSFGHSATTAALLHGLGYQGHVANRVHHATKAALRRAQALEFEWEVGHATTCTSSATTAAAAGSSLRGAGADTEVDKGTGRRSPARKRLLTVVLDDHYSPPSGLDFERAWVDPKSGTAAPATVARVAALLGEALQARAAAHRTPLQLLPLGDDLRFENGAAAYRQFALIDAAVASYGGGAMSGVFGVASLAYSSPGRYMAALGKHRDRQSRQPEALPSAWGWLWPRSWTAARRLVQQSESLPVFRARDFFPFADRHGNDWVGFYGSRPLLKRLVRRVEAAQAAAEAAFALALLHSSAEAEASLTASGEAYHGLNDVREAAALLLHHDAITGTCQPRVARDFLQRGAAALVSAKGVIQAALAALSGSVTLDDRRGHGSEVLQFDVFNPVARARTSIVQASIPRCDQAWVVFHDVVSPVDGSVQRSYLLAQLSPRFILDREAHVNEHAMGGNDRSCDLIVEVDLGPLEARRLQVAPTSDSTSDYAYRAVHSIERRDIFSAKGAYTPQYEWDVAQSVSKQFGAPAGGPVITLVVVEDKRGVASLRAKIRPTIGGAHGGITSELREYLSSDGVGMGKGWGSSSGAYVFRTLLPALIGVGIAAGQGYAFGVALSVVFVLLARRRRARALSVRSSTENEKTQALLLQGNLVVPSERSGTCARGVVAGLATLLLGHGLAKATLGGQFDALLYDGSDQPQFVFDDINRPLAPTQMGDDETIFQSTRRRLSVSHIDGATPYLTAICTSAALATSVTTLMVSFPLGATVVPMIAAAFIGTVLQNPDAESRPLPFFYLSSRFAATVSEGPVLSRMVLSYGGNMNAAQQIIVKHHKWREGPGGSRSDAAAVEVVTTINGEDGHEVVARYVGGAPSDEGATSCAATTDDSVSTQQIPSRAWWGSSVSASFVPLRASASVRCREGTDASFTLTAWGPTGVRATARASGLEVMLHRSLRLDDEKGLKVPLRDPSRAELRHLLSFGGDVVARRNAAIEYASPAIMLQRTEGASGGRFPAVLRPGFVLPPFVSLMSLQWWPTAGIVAHDLAAVRHPEASRILFVRLQHLGIVDPASLDVNGACQGRAVVGLADMFATPPGRRVCAVSPMLLDFTRRVPASSLNSTDDALVELYPGDIAAAMISFC